MGLTPANRSAYLRQLADRIEDSAAHGRGGLVSGDPRALCEAANAIMENAAEIERLRAAEPAPRLVPQVPTLDDLRRGLDGLHEIGSDLEAEFRKRVGALEEQVAKLTEGPWPETHIRACARDEMSTVLERLDALELDRHQDQVVQEWQAWYEVDPVAARSAGARGTSAVSTIKADTLYP